MVAAGLLFVWLDPDIEHRYHELAFYRVDGYLARLVRICQHVTLLDELLQLLLWHLQSPLESVLQNREVLAKLDVLLVDNHDGILQLIVVRLILEPQIEGVPDSTDHFIGYF